MVADKANDSCLVRAYLVCRPQEQPQPSILHRFSLRNSLSYIDQMEELGLPKYSYAAAMAGLPAFLHWVARVDSCDAEFVLAPCREAELHKLPGMGTEYGAFGQHALRVLDFDCCNSLEMSQDGMLRAAECFLRKRPVLSQAWGRICRGPGAVKVFLDEVLGDEVLGDEAPRDD